MIFRIFISSTFSDLARERNALQEYVFPRLAELCQQYGASFRAIDLRWGVSEEASLDQRTMRICLEEITRFQNATSQPYLLILLGERYGWQPLPYAIPASEMAQLFTWLTQEERKLTIWEENKQADSDISPAMVSWMSGQPEGDHGWYRLDTNSAPALYVLQSRSIGTPFADHDYWIAQVEKPLHDILECAARKAFGNCLDPQAPLFKYFSSATHQEIIHGISCIKDIDRHIFGFFRTFTNLPEISVSLPSKAACDYVDTIATAEFDNKAHNKLLDLKNELKAQLGPNVIEFQSHWASAGLDVDHIGTLPATLEECMPITESPEQPKTLCEAVWRKLSQTILQQLSTHEEADLLEVEQKTHDAYGQKHSDLFVGCEYQLRKITDYITSNIRYPLFVKGPPGSGKTALLAKIAVQARGKYPHAIVVSRFIGATPYSVDSHILLESLARQIIRAYKKDNVDIPHEFSALAFSFSDYLSYATAKQPLILVVDALDQLSRIEEENLLKWLPIKLPKYVHMVISTLQGGILEKYIRKASAYTSDLSFVPMQPLSATDGDKLLCSWLAKLQRDPLVGLISRVLTAEQHGDVIAKFIAAGGLPLYLRIAFEQVRHWHSYDGLPSLSENYVGLAFDVPSLIRDHFIQLQDPKNHGLELISHALGLILAARYGLSENEILDMLSADKRVLDSLHRSSPNSPIIKRLPDIVWSRLYFDLQPYLTERIAQGNTTLMSFGHRQVEATAKTLYASGKLGATRHSGLAIYFHRQPHWLAKNQQYPNLRKAAELVYQLTKAGLWTDLTATLTDFDFLEVVVRARSVYDLEADFLNALNAWGGTSEGRYLVVAFEKYLRLEGHHIQRAPELLFPQLYNHLTWLDKPNGPLNALCECAARRRNGWLRLRQNPQPNLPLWEMSIEGHRAGITAIAITQDRRIVTGSYDETIKVWDIDSIQLVGVLEGHSRSVRALALTDNGMLVSASDDCTIRIWDLCRFQVIKTLEGHTESVCALGITPDGQVISGSQDKTIRIWDLQSGRLLHIFRGHAEAVKAIGLTRDGRLVSGSKDKTIKIWDLQSGRILHSFKAHAYEVESIVVTKDGRLISIGDQTVKVWDISKGQLVRKLKHGAMVNALALTEDGQVVSSSDSPLSKNIKIWDLKTGQLVRILHSKMHVFAVAATKNDLLVCGGGFGPDDDMIQVWDLRSGSLLHSHRHPGITSAISITGDGRVVSGSGLEIKIWDLRCGRLLLTQHASETWLLRQFSKLGLPTILGGWISGLAQARQGLLVSSYLTFLGSIKVWDLNFWRLVRCIKASTFGVTAITLTANGQVISGSWGLLGRSKIKVWDLKTGRLLRIAKGFITWVNAFAVSNDGFVASAGWVIKPFTRLRGRINVWDLQSGRLLRILRMYPNNAVYAVAFLGNRELVVGLENGMIEIWDWLSKRRIRKIKGHADAVSTLFFNQKGWLISGSFDRTIKVWDLKNGRLLRSLEGHRDQVRCIAEANDGRIVSGGNDGTIKIWNLDKMGKLGALEGHEGDVTSVSVTTSGRVISAGYGDRTIKVWDLSTGLMQCSFGGHTEGVTAISQVAADRIISGSADGTIRMWDLSFRQLPVVLQKPWYRVGAIIVSEDGQVMCCGCGRWINVWDMQTKRKVRSLRGHSDSILSLAITGDGRLVSGAADHMIRVWDFNSGKLLQTIKGHTAPVCAISLTWNGRIVSGSGDNVIKVWDINNGHLLHSLLGHRGRVSSIVSIDNNHVISGSNDHTIRIWDLEKNCYQNLFGNDAPITSMALSPQKHHLIAGDSIGRVWMFDIIKNMNQSGARGTWSTGIAPPSTVQPLHERLTAEIKEWWATLTNSVSAIPIALGDLLTLYTIYRDTTDPIAAFTFSMPMMAFWLIIFFADFGYFRGAKISWKKLAVVLSVGWGLFWYRLDWLIEWLRMPSSGAVIWKISLGLLGIFIHLILILEAEADA